MDLIKIGKYIAFKRKEQGLTQKQLAEKLNMSDKSVSKWERGICLPDVSVYLELCKILDISINEFLCLHWHSRRHGSSNGRNPDVPYYLPG